ncbi:MAG: hypothetical protein R3F43_27500 [bacterium]
MLAQLHHDRIPGYIEDFTVGTGEQQVFYLVQEFIAGPTLATEADVRRRYTEDGCWPSSTKLGRCSPICTG